MPSIYFSVRLYPWCSVNDSDVILFGPGVIEVTKKNIKKLSGALNIANWVCDLSKTDSYYWGKVIYFLLEYTILLDEIDTFAKNVIV